MIPIERKENSRIMYLDILRIIAVFSVVLLHVSAPFASNMSTNGIKWWWAGNIIDSATRWSVPVLIIISGRLMLDGNREENIFLFFKKRLTKIIIPLIFWSFIYMVRTTQLTIASDGLFILSFLKKLYLGKVHIHLWYPYMIVGLYLITPIIKPYVNNVKKNNLIYFVVIWFITNGIIGFSEKFTGYKLAFNLSFFHWSIGYFVLGYILGKYTLSKKQKSLVYALGLLGLIATIYGTYILTKLNNGIIIDHMYSYYAPNVIFMAIAVFIIIKEVNWQGVIGDNGVIKKIISSLSQTSFGVYLVHLLVLNIISSGDIGIKINALLFNPIIGIPLVSVITFILSHLLTKVLQKIPLINIVVPR